MAEDDRNLPAPQPGPPKPPRTLDREALERVLARAAEMQAHSAGDPGEALTEEQIVELGHEVGIPSEMLRQALAEERTRSVLPQQTGPTGMFGPNGVSAGRVVRGTPEEVLARIDRWMMQEECLQVRRRFPERMTWEPRRDFVGNIRRGFNIGGRGYALTRAAEVGATVVAADAERTIVRLDADVSNARRRSLGFGAVTAGGGAAAAAGTVGFVSLLPAGSLTGAALLGAVWLGIGGASAIGIARSQRKLAERVQLALEQVLDRIEHGEARDASKASSLFDVISQVTKKPW